METAVAIAQLEDADLRAREARDRVVIARSTDESEDVDVLEARAMDSSMAVAALLAAADTAGQMGDEDRRAIRAMRAGMEEADSGILEVASGVPSTGCDDRDAWLAAMAIGAVLTAELRAAIRDARGDWIDGDPGWYPWVRDHLFRFGRERSTQDLLTDVLGRRPTADALLGEISRGGRVR